MESVLLAAIPLLLGGGFVGLLMYKPQRESIVVKTMKDLIEELQEERSHSQKLANIWESKYFDCRSKKRDKERSLTRVVSLA